jgi:amidase
MKVSAEETPPGDLGTRHVMSRSVRDAALAHAIAEQSDSAAPHPPTGLVVAPSSKRLKIAFNTKNYFGDEPDADVKAALENTAMLCTDLGHEIVEVANPIVDGSVFTDRFWTVGTSAVADIRAALEEQYSVAAEDTGLIEPWTLELADWFNAKPADALSESLAYFEDVTVLVETWFEDYDIWLTPVLKSAPPELGVQGPEVPFDTLWERVVNYMSYTPLHNVVGIPAMSVPLSWNNAGLPIGSHFAAPLNGDGTLLSLAFELEEARPWADNWAPYSAVNR